MRSLPMAGPDPVQTASAPASNGNDAYLAHVLPNNPIMSHWLHQLLSFRSSHGEQVCAEYGSANHSLHFEMIRGG